MALGPLLAGLLGVAQRYLAAFIAERVMFDLRVQLFRHVQRQSLGYFASAKSGEVVSRVLNDVQGVGHMMQENLIKLLQNAMVFAVSSAVIFSLDWRLALVAFGLLPAFIYPTRRVGQTRKTLKRRAQARMAEVTGILMETLSVSGALLLKVFGTEKKETKRLEAKARELMEISLRHNLVGRWFQMLMKLFEELGPVMVWAAGGWLVVRGNLKLGTVVAFVALLRKLYAPASDLAGVHVDVVTSYAYFDRIFAVLDLEPAIRNAPDAIRLSEVKGAITFRDLSFSYGPDEPLLRDIDLDIAPGECVAIVGPSGAGKSTLAALVPRLYDPTAGAVLVDGHDIRTLRLKSLRSHIGVVTQETYLFHASILDNLRYARPDAAPEEVAQAARAAQIHDFIAGLPDGYETIVGERGYRLSGGERQRLAIARALLKDPRILILDEATSSLDSTNEALIQAALDRLLVGRTSLIVAHRLATIRKANRIVVLDGGRIVEIGGHAELVAAGRALRHALPSAVRRRRAGDRVVSGRRARAGRARSRARWRSRSRLSRASSAAAGPPSIRSARRARTPLPGTPPPSGSRAAASPSVGSGAGPLRGDRRLRHRLGGRGAGGTDGVGLESRLRDHDRRQQLSLGRGGDDRRQHRQALRALHRQLSRRVRPRQRRSTASGRRREITTGTRPPLAPYLDYFTLPGNERYYDVVIGPVHLFARRQRSPRAGRQHGRARRRRAGCETALAASSSCFDVVYFHHPAYSSGSHGSYLTMRWPFESWGADVVFAGHDHVYERSKVGGIRHITVGLSGNEHTPFGAPDPGVGGALLETAGGAAGDGARRRDLVSVLHGRRRRDRRACVVQVLPPVNRPSDRVFSVGRVQTRRDL